ncbi:hypothetical protein ACQVTU_29050 [Bacillus cereus]|uniref:hypothetical protein n=1 Tax=Bacillus TaxID=1386 RepID=UPI0030F875EA
MISRKMLFSKGKIIDDEKDRMMSKRELVRVDTLLNRKGEIGMEKIFVTHVSLVNGKTHILKMKLEYVLEKVIAPDGNFKKGLIRFEDTLINPEHITSVQQVTSVRTRRLNRIVY